jgi:RNA-directed DNA polymerase
MEPPWFLPRRYKHLDSPVGAAYAQRLAEQTGILKHEWSPLIHYVKRTKRYHPLDGLTVVKDRDIMYASHRDACILSKYAALLTVVLDTQYERERLTTNVIGYRRLGRSNYDFSADAYHFASQNLPCVALCFDIEGFFDNLDHRILKKQLLRILAVEELPDDWYQVFRHVTKFSYIERSDLVAHPTFGPRLRSPTREPVATISEIKAAGIPIKRNVNEYGIPQGTPISSGFSNLYMMDLDHEIAALCRSCNALYQRYSDDILVVCALDHEEEIQLALHAATDMHKLTIKDEKKERALFHLMVPEVFQYLGFNISPNGVVIRPGSLARQWRKVKRGIRKTRKIGETAITKGNAGKIYTKRLRRRFSPVGARNFSAYARRAAKAFGCKKIIRQVLRLERMADQAIS